MWNRFKDLSASVMKNLVVFFITALFVALLIWLFPQITKPQQSIRIIPTALPPVSTPITYGDALNTYQYIAASAIQASERAIDSVKWVVGVIFALSTAASGLGAYLYRTARESIEKAQIASKAAEDAKIAAIKTEEQLSSLVRKYDALFEQYQKLTEQFVDLQMETKTINKTLESWEKGEVSADEVIERLQLESWRKWTKYNNITGWQELLMQADDPGLKPRLRSLIELELERVKKIKKRSSVNVLYKKRLLGLLEFKNIDQ